MPGSRLLKVKEFKRDIALSHSLSLTLNLLREVDISYVLWQDVLEQNFIDQFGGAGLGLVLLQLFLPGIV